MQVVYAMLPHCVACKYVELGTARTFREPCHRQTDVSPQYEGVVSSLPIGEWTKGNGARNVGRAILILRTTVKQQKAAWHQGCVRRGGSLIVYYRSVCGITCYGVEGNVPEQWL